MSRLTVRCFAVSLDGYGAGPNQSLQNPLGERGETLHQWFRVTRTDDSAAERGRIIRSGDQALLLRP